MSLLINGCSFAHFWNPSEDFVKYLQCKDVVNLGKPGTGFDRTVRTTIEWIAANGKPNFVLIPITLSTRWELSIAKTEKDIEGTWYGMQHPEYINFDEIDQAIPKDKLTSLIETYYGLIPNNRTYWDRLFTNLIGLVSFFEAHNIKYLCWDMCNHFEHKHIAAYKGFEKLKIIKENKNIIDLFGFCGNNHMHKNLPDEQQKTTDPYMHHHADKEYRVLESYLIDYLNYKL